MTYNLLTSKPWVHFKGEVLGTWVFVMHVTPTASSTQTTGRKLTTSSPLGASIEHVQNKCRLHTCGCHNAGLPIFIDLITPTTIVVDLEMTKWLFGSGFQKHATRPRPQPVPLTFTKKIQERHPRNSVWIQTKENELLVYKY